MKDTLWEGLLIKEKKIPKLDGEGSPVGDEGYTFEGPTEPT